ncbi:MAG: hypothetical protein QG635_1894 [Bacteroidota bacterium]|nr:hypothetical protein [Bacteroidota bacterium]
MIKHIVLLRLKEFAEGAGKNENIAKMKRLLEELPALIDEIKYYEIGINQMPSERASDIVLISEFETWDDLTIYLNHPEHLRVADFVMKVKEESRSIDYEV